MSYRPEGWGNPHNESYKRLFGSTTANIQDVAYEAGADAMLKVLMEKGLYLMMVNSIPTDRVRGNGFIAFIPEVKDATQ